MNQKIGETTRVDLSPEDARLFVVFQKHYKEFEFMITCGVFEVKGSNAVLHFDEEGALRRIQVLKGFIFQ